METDDARQAESLEHIVEVLVFAAESSISAHRITEVWADVHGETIKEEAIKETVERLNKQYAEAGRALHIEAWAEGYRMATTEHAAPYLQAFFKKEKRKTLSRSLMETIAIVAYRQPVTRPEIEFVRGVSADYAINKLLDLDLVDVTGRSEELGRPLLYGTTDLFLEQFGLSSLDNLPNLRELEELIDEPDFDKEQAELFMEADLEEWEIKEAASEETTTNGTAES